MAASFLLDAEMCCWFQGIARVFTITAGEAQKIDRIMEKFAERYCRDNEGAFASADGPYLLAFALIMLNTDAHNPRAEKKLSCDDFVTMCQAQVSNSPLFKTSLGDACGSQSNQKPPDLRLQI